MAISGKGLIYVFHAFSASLGGAFILGGGGGTGRWAVVLRGLDTSMIFPDFLFRIRLSAYMQFSWVMPGIASICLWWGPLGPFRIVLY